MSDSSHPFLALNKQYIPCQPINQSNSAASFFIFTNDKSLHSEPNQHKNYPAKFYVDDQDEDSSTQLLKVLQQYIFNTGRDVIYVCKEQTLPEHTWQSAAQFSFKLLKLLQMTPCRLLLVASPSNTHASFIHGSALSLAQESSTFQYRTLEANKHFWQNTSSYFETCFSKNYCEWQLHDDTLHYQNWEKINLTHPQQSITGNILITGGSGTLAQTVASYLSHECGCQVFLTGRQELDGVLLDKLKVTGAKAYLKADCTDSASMHEVCSHIEKTHGKITGIFHLAGVLNDGLFQTKSVETYLKTLNAKVQGSLVIEKLVEHFNVDWVVLFSSLSSVIGNVGQTDYAAANSFWVSGLNG
tara:strand:+ start:669 stop:1739 length:1071 start_codon:yes stop_codon:yes gene_type:complete